MKMYKICLHGVDIVCEKVCKTKKDAELEFINLVYENYNKIQCEDYKEESYIEEIEVCTKSVTKRFPNIILFRFWTDNDTQDDSNFYDELEDSIVLQDLDKKILKNTNIMKLNIILNKDKNNKLLDNNFVGITFGVNTSKCKTLDDILDKAYDKCDKIFNKIKSSKFVTMNEKDIIRSKFNNVYTSSFNDKGEIAKEFVKYCNIK